MKPVMTLTVPVADPVARPGVLTDPARLRAWVDTLPYAKPEDAAERLYETLFRLNRTPAAGIHRRELMIGLQRAFERLYPVFMERTLAARSPRHDKRHHRYAALMRDLSGEMAFGYKLMIQPRRGQSPAEATPLTLYQAIHMLAIGMLFAGASYRPPPASAWREICQLYADAERRGLQDTRVADAAWPSQEGASVALLFKRAILLARIDPYRLPPGELWQANEYLAWYADRAQLGPLSEDPPPGAAIVDLEGAGPPSSAARGQAYSPAARFRLVDPQPLRDLLEAHRDALEGPDPHFPRGLVGLTAFRASQLIARIEQSWFEPAHRETEREERYDWLPVACGIEAIVAHLREHVRGHDPYRHPADESVPGMQGTAGKHWQGAPPLASWHQFNRSAGGLGMRVRHPLPRNLWVGQLVLIQDPLPGRGPGWLVGLVRRMIERRAGTTEIGVQFLGAAVRAAAVRPLMFGRNQSPDLQPALLLERPDYDDRGELITPCNLFRQGRELMVDLGSGALRAGMARLIEASPWFERFEYRVSMKERMV